MRRAQQIAQTRDILAYSPRISTAALAKLLDVSKPTASRVRQEATR
jgi:Mn-dependent DtxR family transcriptional regulator